MGAQSPGDFAYLHQELRTVARELLGKADARRAVDWPSMVRAGWLGLEIGDEFDGAGATFAETAVLLIEMGRAAVHTPYLSVAALTLEALNLLEPTPDRDRILRETVSGAVVPVVVLDSTVATMPGDSPAGTAGVGAVAATAVLADAAENTSGSIHITSASSDRLLYGTADLVPDAPAADYLLIPAREPDGTLVVAVVDARRSGSSVTARPVVDETRSLGQVSLDGVRPEAVWRFRRDSRKALAHLYDRAAIALACDSLGVSEAMLDATVAYAGVREQFGRKIGSFQAVKHTCADMLVEVSVARRLVAEAVRAHVEGAPDASVAAAMAKSFTCAAAVRIAGQAMQLHGGIGYTWESGIHVYLKRAALNRALYGSPAAHRRRIAVRYTDMARTPE